MPPSGAGPVLVVIGIVLVVLGLLFWSGALSWFGRLPGDVRIERESFRVYFPLASMLIVSVVLTLVVWIVRKLF